MNPATELAPQLKQLRLSGILDSLDARNRQAIDAKLAYTEFLALLIQDEIARREQKKFGGAGSVANYQFVGADGVQGRNSATGINDDNLAQL